MNDVSTIQPVFTIGHSTHPIERFIELLRQHSITSVADVRSVPYSRFQPQFGRELLAKSLKNHGISYVFLGRELGARSEDPSCYENGKVQYRRLAETELFQEGLARIMRGSKTQKIALLCTEAEPLACHRTILVSRELDAASIPVLHILTDGSIEKHSDAVMRLMEELKLEPSLDFFRTPDELAEQAYTLQEKRIAYDSEDAAAVEGVPS